MAPKPEKTCWVVARSCYNGRLSKPAVLTRAQARKFIERKIGSYARRLEIASGEVGPVVLTEVWDPAMYMSFMFQGSHADWGLSCPTRIEIDNSDNWYEYCVNLQQVVRPWTVVVCDPDAPDGYQVLDELMSTGQVVQLLSEWLGGSAEYRTVRGSRLGKPKLVPTVDIGGALDSGGNDFRIRDPDHHDRWATVVLSEARILAQAS